MDKSQLYKVPLKYGLAGGAIAIVLFFTLYFSDGEPLANIRIFDFILIPIFIFFTLKELRDYKYGGKMFYWQGMTAGFVCYLLIALLSGLTIWIFLEGVDPALFVAHKKENIAILTSESAKWIEQLGQADYEKTLANLQTITPFSLAADDFLKKLLIGLLITSLFAIFFKRT